VHEIFPERIAYLFTESKFEECENQLNRYLKGKTVSLDFFACFIPVEDDDGFGTVFFYKTPKDWSLKVNNHYFADLVSKQ
jgi:hypothetical protein